MTVVKGSDLRILDLGGLDVDELAPWLSSKRRGRARVWWLDETHILADVDLITDMNWWGIGIDNPVRDEVRRRRWEAAKPTIADVRDRMALRCRLGRHAWEISSVVMSGHQSSRTHRCRRCLDRGLLVTREEPRGYFGGKVREPMGAIEVRRLEVDLP